jgi:uncharacterized repeat protein (TIGR01451 family)
MRINQNVELHSPFHGRIYVVVSTIFMLGLLFALSQPSTAIASFIGAHQPAKAADTLQGPDWNHLNGIYKTASKEVLSFGEEMTYTIHLEMGWTTGVIADVIDPLPVGLDYVTGSANLAGVYDPGTRTVSWTKVAVSNNSPINLTFEVQDTAQVTQPTPTINNASITIMNYVVRRQAWVTLMPSKQSSSDLRASHLSAWPSMLGPGQVVTYTVHLLNFGSATATVQVSDTVPALLTYVADSVSSGGVYDASTNTISWSGIDVQPMKPVLLTFAARAPDKFSSTNHPQVVKNTATITSGSESFERSVGVLLVKPKASSLEGSFKTADYKVVAAGQVFTYTINLHNSSEIPISATVSDTLPVQVNYIPGSASDGGTYDDANRTLSWNDIAVPESSPVLLTFTVQAESPVITPTRVVNNATISSGGTTLKRSAKVWLMSQATGDNIPPVVHSFTIGDRDVYTSPQVTLSISATDNVTVSWMCLKEWALTTTPIPHWQEVNSSGWVPFQDSYLWTLSNQSGSHFIGVWVADSALNRSHLTRNAIDFASLLLSDTQVDQGGMIPYLVYYPAGVQVTGVLNVLSGNAGLFVWHPGNMFSPDESSPAPDSDTQTITFTTKTDGTYMFLVYGVKTYEFDLSITPGGGPRAVMYSDAAGTAESNASGLTQIMRADGITYNPVLPQSGLDPLNVATDPNGPYYLDYLPTISR